MKNIDFFSKTKGKLIVSCQALDDEPLHSSFVMSRIAYAVMLGGAAGIRANSVEDIIEIKKEVSLPIVGIIKRDYPGYSVYITPTISEVDALVQCGVDVIATDATNRIRPGGISLDDFFAPVRAKYPDQLFMADCSNLEEAVHAEKIGFDVVSTTLCGYTEYTQDDPKPNFPLITEMTEKLRIPVVVEGGIWDKPTFEAAMAVKGVHAVVIGSAITRPMEITKYFLKDLPA